MNREKKTTFARAVAPVVGFVLATLSCPAPVLAAPFSASGVLYQEFYPAGPPGASSAGPTGASFSQQFVAGSVVLNANAVAGNGNLSLFALASMSNMTDWSSGHISSTARGSIIESIAPTWQLWLNPGETIIFEYEVSVSGGLFAASGGLGDAGSSADLLYTYRVGDSHGAGTWSKNSAGQESKSGTWNGVISSAFTVHRNSNFELELRATAGAGGGKTYVPGSNTTLLANADFSHTMTWLGITGVQAFDSLGNEIPLPPDFSLPLIGQESGFDYWHSAAAPEAVPEPATALLLGSGLVLAGLIRKSALRRKDS